MDTIKFKDTNVSIVIEDIDFDEFMKKMGEKRNKEYNVVGDGDIDLTILNTNLAQTRLNRFHYQNSKNETINVIQQSEALGDDVDFTFYLSDKKIEDKDVIDLINYCDEYFDKKIKEKMNKDLEENHKEDEAEE